MTWFLGPSMSQNTHRSKGNLNHRILISLLIGPKFAVGPSGSRLLGGGGIQFGRTRADWSGIG
jgi:hypothetical protein